MSDYYDCVCRTCGEEKVVGEWLCPECRDEARRRLREAEAVIDKCEAAIWKALASGCKATTGLDSAQDAIAKWRDQKQGV